MQEVASALFVLMLVFVAISSMHTAEQSKKPKKDTIPPKEKVVEKCPDCGGKHHKDG